MEMLYVCTLIVVYFLIGVVIGLKLGKAMKGEQVKIIPDIKSPIQVYKEKQEKKIIEEAQNDLRRNLENINNYVGDSSNQKDF